MNGLVLREKSHKLNEAVPQKPKFTCKGRKKEVVACIALIHVSYTATIHTFTAFLQTNFIEPSQAFTPHGLQALASP
jgi:hypothetical protein